MIRTQIYLHDDQYRELKLLAATGEMNISQLIREGITHVLKSGVLKDTQRKRWKNFIGADKSKHKTNAVKDIHEYYHAGAT